MPDLAPAPFQDGEVVAGRYRIVRALGEGGMALVYEGVHLRLQQAVAVKVLRPELRFHTEHVARFEREGRAIGKLRSRHIVRVFDVDTTPDGVPFLVMELLEGGSLEDELVKRGALPIGEAVTFLIQACAAVAEAHDHGVIHRDLKPSNMLLATEGDERIVKVLDFGISKNPDDDARITKTETIMGSPLYMAPEQFRSTKDVDARADVWALGATLYELLAGRPPFIGAATSVAVSIVTEPLPALSTFREGLPAGLVAVIDRALAKKRDERFPTVRELSAALTPFAGIVDSVNPPPSLVMRATDSAHPNAVTMLNHATDVMNMNSGAKSAPSVSSPEIASTTSVSGAEKNRGRPLLFVAGVALLGVLVVGALGVHFARPTAEVGPAAPAVSIAVAAPSTTTSPDPIVSAPSAVASNAAVPPVMSAAALNATAARSSGSRTPAAATVAPTSTSKPVAAKPAAPAHGTPPIFFPADDKP